MTLRGSVASFPLETIVQLIAATAKTGQLEIRSGGESGTIGFADGRLVSAMSGDDSGDLALGAVFALADGEFEFIPWDDPPAANLTGDLNQLLDRAVVQRDRIVGDRELIPDDRMRFAMSDRAAAQGEVRLSAEQWRTLLAVNGARDLRAIAEQLSFGRLGTLVALADLVRSGIIDASAPPEPPSGPGSGSGGARAEWRDSAPAATAPAADAAAPAADAAPPWEAPAEPGRSRDVPVSETADREASSEGASPPPAAEPQDEREIDPRLAALSGASGGATATPTRPTQPEPAQPPEPRSHAGSPAPVPPSSSAGRTEAEPVAAEEPKKRGGLFSGLFKRDEPEARTAALDDAPGEESGTRVTQLAALANGLLDEFKNGEYGSGRIDDRIADLLMRVDEQADPIDRSLPVVNDRIDVAALERVSMPDEQVAPYLALLVSQIYEDAERAFGRDNARRGYKSVQQAVIGDSARLGSDLHLPRV